MGYLVKVIPIDTTLPHRMCGWRNRKTRRRRETPRGSEGFRL